MKNWTPIIALSLLLLLESSTAFLPNHNSNVVLEQTNVLESKVPAIGTANFQYKKCLRFSSQVEAEAEVEESFFSKDDLDLLQDALVSNESSGASKILNKFREMRNADTSMEASVDYLNGLLQNGPDRSLPIWATVLPLSRFSRRARWASLKRTLDLTTPPPEDDTVELSKEDELRRQRRALVALLQSLTTEDSSGVAIRALERKARREQKGNSNSKDIMWNRRPTELETPNYTVVADDNPQYQIRLYDPFSVCSVAMNQARPAFGTRTEMIQLG